MITPTQILNKYRSVEQYLEPVRSRVRDSLLILCEAEGFALVSRIKTLASVAEKVETGRFRRWGDIDDLVAITIVVPTLTREPAVLVFLQDTFETIDVRQRGSTLKAPDVFRFDSTRFIGRLPTSEAARGPIHDIPFEVQIRSAFEHAWSVTTHALAYKSPEVSWSKLRLTAQLKAAVEQLDTLILAFDDAAKYIQPNEWPEIAAKAELRTFFSDAVTASVIPEELSPKDWSRFVDNVYRLVSSGPGRLRAPQIVNLVQTAFSAEVASLKPDAFPRSISLWQFTLASLFKAGSVTTPLQNHWPLITPELEDLYPELRGFGPRFDYG